MELILLAAFSALVGLGCLGGAVWAVVGGEDVGVERIFLVLVWLLFGSLFLGLAVWIARQGPLQALGKNKKPAPETEEKPEPVAKTAP